MIKVKWIVSSILGVFLLYRQNGYWFSLSTGAVVNAIAVKILKRILNRPRPDMTIKTDPGMPSSHAHMLSYFAAFAALTGAYLPLSVCASLFTIAVSYERVSRGIHSFAQCGVGTVTGSLGALAWVKLGGHQAFLKLDESIFKEHDWRVTLFIGFLVSISFLVLSTGGRFLSGKFSQKKTKRSSEEGANEDWSDDE